MALWVKIIKIIKDPLIVLESYICICVPIWWNFFNFFYISSILLELSTVIWWGVSLKFLNYPSIVTGNLDGSLYTQALIKFLIINISSLLQEISEVFWEGVIEISFKKN